MPTKAGPEGEPITDCTSSLKLDAKLKAKEPRLPRRVAAHIRTLKQEGMFDEAMRYRERIIGQKKARYERLQSATDELHKTIREMICTDDPVKEGAANIKITWLFNAVGQITSTDERNREILEILNSVPSEFQPKVEELMPAIRNEVEEKFMPLAG
mgnify:CR=1 FL=1